MTVSGTVGELLAGAARAIPNLIFCALRNDVHEAETAAGTLDASATVSYSSEIFHTVNHTVVRPAVALFSTQAGYEFASRLRVGVYGKNLTNERVIQGSILSPAGHLQTLNAPREAGLKLDFLY